MFVYEKEKGRRAWIRLSSAKPGLAGQARAASGRKLTKGSTYN